MRIFRLMGASVMFAGAIVSQSSAQASPCLSQADSVARFAEYTERIYQHGDSTYWVGEGLPWAAQGDVHLVTDSTTCAAGVVAFNQLFDETDTSAYIFSVGGSGYAYIRPNHSTNSYGGHPVHLFNLAWMLKGLIAS